MLTTQDLDAIRTIVEQVVDEKLNGRFRKFEGKVDNRFIEFEKRFDEKFESQFKKELTPIRRDIKRLRKDLNVFIRTFDSEQVDLQRQMQRVEEYLNLPPLGN